MDYKILNTTIAKLKEKYFLFAILFAVTVIGILFWSLAGSKPSRSEKYEDISGAAGLNATVTYDCQEQCDQKYNFNVYILADYGRQVSVVQPNDEGQVRLALPEGDYVMLIGKMFGKSDTFPQEPIALKNGKELKIELQYGEG